MPGVRIMSACVLCGLFGTWGAVGNDADSGSSASAESALRALFADYHEWRMAAFPEEAIRRGDYRYADRFTDMSIAGHERRHAQRRAFQSRLGEIARDDLSREDRLNYDLFAWELDQRIDGHKYRMWLAPIGPRSGPHQRIPQLHERMRFSSEEDYGKYLRRLESVPTYVAQVIELLRAGAQEGRTPPQIVMRGIPGQFALALDGGLAGLGEPLEKFPEVIDEDTRAALRTRFAERSLPAVEQAMREFGAYVTNEYLPQCRETIAATDLPDGGEYYAYMLRRMTTTGMSAREIHALGLREVARIRAEMIEVIRRSDFFEHFPEARTYDDDRLFAAFLEYLRTDERFYYERAGELLTGYRDICKRIDAHLPKLFRRLPRLPYGVRKIPDFMAPNQTTAYYSSGNLEAGQPGYFYANVYALNQRPKYEMISLALHEAVPGHHLQVALAQEAGDVPEFRQDLWITAYGEGWALYAERLGIEMGMYEDPYDDFGRLLYEMWRACRLVVDPGMHALGWSRRQAINFMLENAALSELNITTEVDRYIFWPGQACGYKIGELEIRKLRREAKEALGERFDLRAFHDAVLSDGSVPLEMLKRRLRAWIEEEKATANSRDGAE